MAREIVAIYRERGRAEAAQSELLQAGLPPTRVHLHHALPAGEAAPRRGGWQGALLGGALGFIVGGLATIALSMFPAFSWILASDGWASLLGASAGGAWLGAIAGGLGERRRRRARARRAAPPAQSLLRVDADERDVDRVTLILRRHDPDRIDLGLPAGPGVERTRLAQNRPETVTRPGRPDEEPV